MLLFAQSVAHISCVCYKIPRLTGAIIINCFIRASLRVDVGVGVIVSYFRQRYSTKIALIIFEMDIEHINIYSKCSKF